ncbi:hypothetical protein Pryu01_00471 [Paraliobacillus ryukyuensis]|uniref:Uncharacterized protein n=1 Tax=Paraliobacillus ryukyuensis TaxID=200904 RepID=A0A366EHH5_9BACI|nr:hypothetical protein DES48_101193 [Paraliobacillus ryukyuensis]
MSFTELQVMYYHKLKKVNHGIFGMELNRIHNYFTKKRMAILINGLAFVLVYFNSFHYLILSSFMDKAKLTYHACIDKCLYLPFPPLHCSINKPQFFHQYQHFYVEENCLLPVSGDLGLAIQKNEQQQSDFLLIPIRFFVEPLLTMICIV